MAAVSRGISELVITVEGPFAYAHSIQTGYFTGKDGVRVDLAVRVGDVLKLIEECLTVLGFEAERARKAVSPLRHTHDLRSKLKSHAGGEGATAAKKIALTDFGSYQKHFRTLCQECDESMGVIVEAFKKLA
jgi:hypothetical protein